MNYGLMAYDRMNFKESASVKRRIDFKPPYNQAARLLGYDLCVEKVSPSADRYCYMGIGKYPVDRYNTPNDPDVILDEGDIDYKEVIIGESETAVGFQVYKGSWARFLPQSLQQHYVLDPTLLIYADGIAVHITLYYDFVTLSSGDFNRILQWQGGFENREV